MKTKKSRNVGYPTIPFLILCIFAVVSIGIAQASPSISIDPAAITDLNKSDTFSVNVKVDPAGQDVAGAEFKLNFNPAVLQLESITLGSFLGSAPKEWFNEFDNTLGTVHLGHTVKAGNPAVTSPGTYATLNFKVKSNAPEGTSNLDLNSAKLSKPIGSIIQGVEAKDGTITVKAGETTPGTPSISISPLSITNLNQGDTFSVDVNVDPEGNQVKGVEINLSFDNSEVQLDSVVVKNFLGSDPQELLNNTDNTNGTLQLEHTVKSGNPAVTSPGTYATLNFKVKSSAPAGTSKLDLTKAKLSNDTGIDIPGVVDNDGTITVKASGGTPGAPSISIVPPSITNLNQSDTFSVNVDVDPAGKDVKGVELKLSFNPAVVQLQSVNIGNFLGSSPQEFFNDTDNTLGTLHLGHTVKPTNPAVTTSGTYAILNFKVKSNALAGTSNLDLTMAKLKNSSGSSIPGVEANDGTITVGEPAPGSNLKMKYISVPYLLKNSSVDYVLRGLVKGTDYTEIYAWDSATKQWVSPANWESPNNFTTLRGYLIKIDVSKPMPSLEKETGPYAPPSLDMNRGWNLVGTSGTSAMSAEIMLQSIDDSYYSIWNWNIAGQKYDTAVGVNSNSRPPGSVGTDAFMMQPGIGYWVFATKDTALAPLGP